jgi:Helix-turn-helix.
LGGIVAKGRGGGNTPKLVTYLLKDAVEKSSIRAVARESGLTQSAVYRYLQGIGEPSLSTLERLATYFQVSVAYLRGDVDSTENKLKQFIKNHTSEIRSRSDDAELMQLFENFIKNNPDAGFAVADVFNTKKMESIVFALNINQERLQAEIERLQAERDALINSEKRQGLDDEADVFIEILSCLLEIYEIVPERLKDTFKIVIEGYRDDASNIDFTKIPCEKYKQLDALTSKAWDIFYGDAEFDTDGVLLGRK